MPRFKAEICAQPPDASKRIFPSLSAAGSLEFSKSPRTFSAYRSDCLAAAVDLVDSMPLNPYIIEMKAFTAVIERCSDTGLYVGFVPGFHGAHSQGETLDELHSNLREVLSMLLEDGEPIWETEFVGTQNISVPA